MRIKLKHDRITSISATIQTNHGDARCQFFPTTKRLLVFEDHKSRDASVDERRAFRFEFFGRKSEILDELDRQTATGNIRTGTKVMASRLEKATPLVESAFC